MRFRAGERVVVRDRDEILASLDRSGELESMPFMAEMLQFCGRQFEVLAVAHKTCDTIHKTGGRRVARAVHLKDLRCDGSSHGQCQAGCLLFWKTEWLRPAGERRDSGRRVADRAALGADKLPAAAVRRDGHETVYSCQATRLFAASSPLRWWDIRQYLADLWYGNVGLGRFLRVAALRALYGLRSLPVGYRYAVACYNFAHLAMVGRPTPYEAGVIPNGHPTPTESLKLSPGDWVEVRPHDEIRQTLTERNFNRGMSFDPEMAQFCGRRFRVDRSVERIIDERTGRMMAMKSPCIVLDGAVCSSEYSPRRIFCPRQIQPYFREIWLRRATPAAPDTSRAMGNSNTEPRDQGA